ncbi:MAG TPA: MFS transporter, partial [Candidatus Limnocylindrales bacterium]|nr:MFS transporter [Candidatus Limnocylindrales bacterium]
MFGGLGGLLPYVSLYYLDRGLDYREIGALLSANALVVLLAGPLWGSLSDALRGSPRVLLAAGALAVAGVAALALATSFTTILLCNVAIGGGTAGILPILDARALESSGEQRAGWGRLRAWGSAGWVASSLLTGLAIEGWGHGSIFVIAALGFATAATLASGLVPVVHAPAERPLRAALRLFATRSLGLFLIGALLANIAMAAALDFITPRFNELGASAILVGIAWALPAAIEVPVMAG